MFPSIIKFVSTHLILAIVAILDSELHQINVKTTFLNKKLDKKIYMNQQIVSL
jgi:hypothetical protein